MSDDIAKYIREVSNFPKPGVRFYDITTLLLDPVGLTAALDQMESFVRSCKPDILLGIESRGFLFGAALADRLGLGLALARKAGKLPAATVAAEYDLEYGTDRVEVHAEVAVAINPKYVNTGSNR